MRKFILSATLVCLMFASAATASTILQFTQLTFNGPLTITANGAGTASTITAVDVPVNVIFDPLFCSVPGCGGATNGTYFFNLSASSSSAASFVNGGNDINQNFAGSFSFTNGGINLLTVAFDDLLAGSVNGSTPTMASSQPPDTFTGSSNVLDPTKLGVPRGFAFSFSNLLLVNGVAPNTGLNVFGSTVASSTADITGTINATPAAVPSSSLLLFGSGMMALAHFVRRRRR